MNKTSQINNLHRHHHKPHMAAYPDYNKSLIQQRHPHPIREGLSRGAKTGALGAAIGALMSRLVTDNPAAVAGTAAATGVASAIPGFISGRNQARSDFSKLLYLRRRAGIKEPGEYDAVLQSPELMGELTQKEAAPLSPAVKGLLKGIGVAGAGVGGWALGNYGTSKALGYQDDPVARHFGAGINAMDAAALAGLLATRGRAGVSEILTHHPLLAGGAFGMEALPVGVRAVRDLARANQDAADQQVAPSVGRALTSNTARGAGVGAGLAALASIASGLSRVKTDREIQEHRGRPSMVAHDFARYAIPAAIAGGVAGSLKKEPQE